MNCFIRDVPANFVEYHSMGAPWCSVMKRKTLTLLTQWVEFHAKWSKVGWGGL